MRLLILLAAIVCASAATALGFGHFSEHAADFGGWLAAAILCSLVSTVVPE